MAWRLFRVARSLVSDAGDARDTLALALSHKGLARVGLRTWERGRPARKPPLARGAPSP